MSSNEGSAHGQQLLLTMGPLQLNRQLYGRKHSGMSQVVPVSSLAPSRAPASEEASISPPDELLAQPNAKQSAPSFASPDAKACDIKALSLLPPAPKEIVRSPHDLRAAGDPR